MKSCCRTTGSSLTRQEHPEEHLEERLGQVLHHQLAQLEQRLDTSIGMAGPSTGFVEIVDSRRIAFVGAVEDKPIEDAAIRIGKVAFEVSHTSMAVDWHHRVDWAGDAIVRCTRGNQFEWMEGVVEDTTMIVDEQMDRR
jgi:hypothetical protein